jgi:hypothetical protein
MAEETAEAAAAMRRLEVFIGEWDLEASFPGAAPSADASDVEARAVFEWELGGKFLVERSSISHPEAPDGLILVAPTADGRAYTQHYFDSRGVVRLYAMTFVDGVWTLTRETSDFTPLEFSQRFIGTFSADGNTIDGRWEICQDGSTWRRDFGLVYTKVG